MAGHMTWSRFVSRNAESAGPSTRSDMARLREVCDPNSTLAKWLAMTAETDIATATKVMRAFFGVPVGQPPP